jgi:uncharacterized protein (TIGR02246 family)
MSEAVIARVLEELQAAWNSGDGVRLAAVFADDATMIDVRGRVVRGRDAIGAEHQALFDTIFSGSTFRIELLDTRTLGDGLVLAHTRSVVQIPSGPRAGENRGIQTQLIRDGEILAFQNTLCAE